MGRRPLGGMTALAALLAAATLLSAPACDRASEAQLENGSDTDADTDSDGDGDADSDVDADTDTFNDQPDCDYGAEAGCFAGDFTISDAADIAEFMLTPCITGTLAIRTDSLSVVALPALSAACHLAVVESPSLEALALDGLERVDGNLDLYSTENLSSVSLGDLETVEGDVRISRAESLTDMTGFEALQRVGGSLLYAWDGDLTSLSGLDSLSEIGGWLDFQSCHGLETVDGLGALTSVGGVGFRSCWGLTDICALAGVADWSGGLATVDSPVANLGCLDGMVATTAMDILVLRDTTITSLDVLSGLTAVEYDLDISDNAGLTDLGALSGLVSVGESFDISGDPALAGELSFPALTTVGNLMRFDSLPAVTSIRLDALAAARDLQVSDCASLETLSLPAVTTIDMDLTVFEGNTSLAEMDFSSLTSIGEDLWIDDTALTSLDGLSALQSLGADLRCTSNTALPTCEAIELRDRLVDDGWTGEADIEGNLPDECGE